MHPDYYRVSKVCLARLLDLPEISVTKTSRLFVDYVRKLWKSKKVSKHYNRLKQCKYFLEDIKLKDTLPPIDPEPLPPPDLPDLPILPASPGPSSSKKLKSYDSLSRRQKNRVIKKLRDENHIDAIIDSVIQYFKEKHQNDAAYVVNELRTEVMNDSHEIAKDLRDFMNGKSLKNSEQISKTRALAFLLDRGLTRVDYDEMRKLFHGLLPCYTLLQKEKAKSRPNGKSFTFC